MSIQTKEDQQLQKRKHTAGHNCHEGGKNTKLPISNLTLFDSIFVFCRIFVHLSQESNQCAIRAHLGVASYLSTTPTWGNPAKCLSQRHSK